MTHLGTETDASASDQATISDTQLASSLRAALTRLNRRLHSERGDETLGLSHMSGLITLERYGRLSPTAMAEIEWIQLSSMSRIISGLVRRGLARREPHRTDRRQVVIAITDAGQAVVDEDRRRNDAWLARIIRSLSAEERDALAGALDVIEHICDL